MSKENADFLMQAAMDSGITSHRELANFMGQMQVESGGFAHMEESLHYSPDRLLSVFGGRNGISTPEQARAVVSGGPEAIANAVYGGEWGRRNLGNIEPGDGYTYRGRGYVQLTGRDGYESAGRDIGVDLVDHPELASDRTTAAKIAVSYWARRVVAHGHQTDIRDATIDINGGTNGLEARREAAAEWERKLDAGYRPGQPDPTLSASAKQTAGTRQLQADLHALGYTGADGHALTIDGRDGPDTRAAVTAFQRDHDLRADGVAGEHTLAALSDATQARPPSKAAASTLPDQSVTAARNYWNTVAAGAPTSAAVHNSTDQVRAGVQPAAPRLGL
jgi:putative chitinase